MRGGVLAAIKEGMFNIGPGELALILVAALIVLGPKRLPDSWVIHLGNPK